MKEIRDNVWNDYSSGEISNLVFSPAVYDMMMISDASSYLTESHQKGYTMQQFVAVYDGSKVFTENPTFKQDWSHKKKYLVSVFQVVSKLLDKGICMTDLKPENTLYDADNGRGMLIDLAGVVRKENRNELIKCKVKYIKELTKSCTEPTLLKAIESEEENAIIDLPKCMSFSLGIIIQQIVLKVWQDKSDPLYEMLDNLSKALTIDLTQETSQRISVEEGLKRLKLIGEDTTEIKTDFKVMIDCLMKETEVSLKKFGLNEHIHTVEKNIIKLWGAELNPEKYEKLKLGDIQMALDQFIIAKESKEKVFVLMGSSGSGKSTILQLKYLEALKNWKKNDPIPFFINLSVEMI